jgi:hypothetical protein
MKSQEFKFNSLPHETRKVVIYTVVNEMMDLLREENSNGQQIVNDPFLLALYLVEGVYTTFNLEVGFVVKWCKSIS